MRPFMSVALLAMLATPLAAQPPKYDAKAIAATIAPFIDEQTVAAIHINPLRTDPVELTRLVLPTRADNDLERREFQSEITRWMDGCRKLGVKDMFILFSLADWNEPIAYVVPLKANVDPKTALSLLGPFVGKAKLNHGAKGNVLFVGSKLIVKHLQSIKPISRPELTAALEAAGDGDIQLAVIPTRDQRKALLEMLPIVARGNGAESLKAWASGMQWAAASASLSPKLTLKMRVQSESNEAATSLSANVPDLLRIIGQKLTGKSQDPFGGMLKPEVAGSELRAEAAEPDVAKALSGFATTAIEFILHNRHANELTKIARAVYDYFETNHFLPGWAYYGPIKIDTNDSRNSGPMSPFTKPNKDAQPLLSWRVMILPYLGHGDLFRQFNLNEPWDSEHNIKLLPHMPSVYRSRNAKLDEAGRTRILAPVGSRTVFPPDGERLTFADIPDGLANTILLVEAADHSAVIWTKPGDWQFDPNAADPWSGLLNPNGVGFLAVWAGGQAGTVIKKDTDNDMLRLLFIRDSNLVKKAPDRTKGFHPLR